jgi:hypothetical protein
MAQPKKLCTCFDILFLANGGELGQVLSVGGGEKFDVLQLQNFFDDSGHRLSVRSVFYLSRLFGLWQNHGPPAVDPNTVLAQQSDGLRVSQVFLLEYSMGQGVLIVILLDGNGSLQNNRSVVQFLVHKVDGAPRHFGSPFQGLLLGVQTWKGG